MSKPLPEVTTPAELANRLGWSERRVRDKARELGACRILGNRMVLLPQDVAQIEYAILNGNGTPSVKQRPSYRRAHVYFFQQENFVKIGWSNSWRQRLLTLQTATPFEIKVLAIYRGGIALERSLHARFEEHRVRLEWFKMCNEIVEYIQSNAHKCLKDAKNEALQK